MVGRNTEYNRQPSVPSEEDRASEYEQEEAEGFHPDEVLVDESESILEAPAVSPGRFFARLRAELAARGLDYDKLPRLTYGLGPPPCFAMAGVPYGQWLASASLLGATVPYRYDMPAEPNYCWDCTSKFKGAALAAGTCQFPNVRFERTQTVIREETGKTIEVELVGISRSKSAAVGRLCEISSLEDDDA